MGVVKATLRREVPRNVEWAVRKAGTSVSNGLPKATWNGMTRDTFTVGSSHGDRQVHLLLPGVHRTTAADAQLHFVWSPRRQELWDELVRTAPELMDKYGIRYVIGGGSFFTTDVESPGDMDLVVFRDPATKFRAWHNNQWKNPLSDFNRVQGDHGISLFPANFSVMFPGGPKVLGTFRHAPGAPRPRKNDFGGPRGPEVGLVLIDLQELRK